MPNDQPKSPTSRFTDRAPNYAKYRPTYPVEIVDYLEERKVIGMIPGTRIADIGSGTGLFARLFLGKGYEVIGIEPNDAMRKEATRALAGLPGFTTLDGTAEHTGLETGSMSFLTAAQAFHWFEPIPVRSEFDRVLAPGGHVLLAWNILQEHTPFLKGYHALKEKYAEDLQHPYRANEKKIREFFAPADVEVKEFRHSQALTWEELKGYFQSFSTVPLKGMDGHGEMMIALRHLFDASAVEATATSAVEATATSAVEATVEMNYITHTYLCRLKPV